MPATYDGITSPDSGDEFKPVQDLAAMGVSIQEALNKRANAYKGTSAQRQSFTSEAPEGVLWKDTNGIRGLYTKWGSGWQQIWPLSNSSISVGSITTDMIAQFQVRRFFPDSGDWSHVNYSSSRDVNTGFIISNWLNNQPTSGLELTHSGKLGVRSGGVMRYVPFATRSGTYHVSQSVPANGASPVTVPFTFQTGLYTETPSIHLNTENGRLNAVVHNASPAGFTARVWNFTSSPSTTSGFDLHWLAIQT